MESPTNKAEGMGEVEEEMGSSVAESGGTASPKSEGQHSAGDGAIYYAKGLEVWKRPERTLRSGGHSITLGFKVCTVSPEVGSEGAETVAAMLTMAERFEKRTNSAEPMGCPLPGACACPAESAILSPSEASAAAPATDEPPSPPTGRAILKDTPNG